jgi:hypothetical protein
VSTAGDTLSPFAARFLGSARVATSRREGSRGNRAVSPPARVLLVVNHVDTDTDDNRRYTAKCVYCARTVFSSARSIGENQLRMAELHVLICRPLVAYERRSELLTHFRIAAAAA